MYVEELIGPESVDTVPNATLAAFREHGPGRPSLEEQVAGARDQLQRLADVGIELDKVTSELEVEGVQSFVKSYDSLLDVIRAATRNVVQEGAMRNRDQT